MKAREFLLYLEQRGKGKPPLGVGGTDVCVCPKCGYEVPHKRGVPCNLTKCPKCGTPMTGKGTPGSIEPNASSNVDVERNQE